VPSILCGAAYGRIWGHVLTKMGFETTLYPGSFALIGSAAFVGGVVRMTISLTVILIETTNEITYGLPIMVTLLAAKFIGDLFNFGLYDIHNEMKGIPFLEWSAPDGMEELEARDVMESRLHCLLPHSTVESVIKLLKTTKHHSFPVVTPDSPLMDKEEADFIKSLDPGITSENIKFRTTTVMEENKATRAVFGTSDEISGMVSLLEEKDSSRRSSGTMVDRYAEINAKPTGAMYQVRFHGIILRTHLVAMLKNNINYDPDAGPESQYDIDYWTMIDDYPRHPPIDEVDINRVKPSNLMNLTPYMNDSPYVVAPHLVVPKVFNLFRTMGLRHLPVLNSIGEIVGIITRNDLTHQSLLNKLIEKSSNIATSAH